MSDLEKFPVISIIVVDDTNDAEPIAKTLLEGRLNIIEVTSRTAAAAEAIERIENRFPGMMTGAGTVVIKE